MATNVLLMHEQKNKKHSVDNTPSIQFPSCGKRLAFTCWIVACVLVHMYQYKITCTTPATKPNLQTWQKMQIRHFTWSGDETRSKSTTRPPRSPVARWWPVLSNCTAEMISAATPGQPNITEPFVRVQVLCPGGEEHVHLFMMGCWTCRQLSLYLHINLDHFFVEVLKSIRKSEIAMSIWQTICVSRSCQNCAQGKLYNWHHFLPSHLNETPGNNCRQMYSHMCYTWPTVERNLGFPIAAVHIRSFNEKSRHCSGIMWNTPKKDRWKHAQTRRVGSYWVARMAWE